MEFHIFINVGSKHTLMSLTCISLPFSCFSSCLLYHHTCIVSLPVLSPSVFCFVYMQLMCYHHTCNQRHEYLPVLRHVLLLYISTFYSVLYFSYILLCLYVALFLTNVLFVKMDRSEMTSIKMYIYITIWLGYIRYSQIEDRQ